MKMMRKEIIFILLVAFASSLLGCASEPMVQKAVPASSAPAVPETPKKYTIHPGDQLSIKFFYNPELNEEVTVRPDGKIALQLIDEVRTSGKTPPELDKMLTDLYSRELRKPLVTVIVKSFSAQRIYVGGEVTQQGLLTLPAGMTVLQAIFEAGGFKETAKPSETIVIRKGEDNRPIPFRLDLAAAMNGNGSEARFKLQSDDVVYVPKSSIAQANKFVNQYIEKLFLFRGVSFGFSYVVHTRD